MAAVRFVQRDSATSPSYGQIVGQYTMINGLLSSFILQTESDLPLLRKTRLGSWLFSCNRRENVIYCIEPAMNTAFQHAAHATAAAQCCTLQLLMSSVLLA